MTNQSFCPAIGLLDSGHGTLDFIREVLLQAPEARLVVIADLAFSPYGQKEALCLQSRVEQLTQILWKQGCEGVLLACNTATNTSIDYLRNRDPHRAYFGIEPYINVIHQQGSALSESSKKGKVAALMTEATANGDKFKKLLNKLDPYGQVKILTSPSLAYEIEQFIATSDLEHLKSFLRQELGHLVEFEHLILGCTHYPLIDNVLEDEFSLKTYNTTKQVVKHVLKSLGAPEEEEGLLSVDREKHTHQRSFSFLDTRWGLDPSFFQEKTLTEIFSFRFP